MPTASQKADKIERHERYKAKLAARESSQVAAFDAQAQAASKQRLAAFWHKHSARFELWWRAHVDRAAATAATAIARPPQGRIGQVHALLLPELSPAWLAATGSEPSADGTEAAWPPPARGLVWLMRTRAAAASTNADDVADLAAVSAIFVDAEHDARRFPGLTEAQHADVFVGLGAGFSCATALGPRVLARGEEIEAVGGAKVEILMADLRGGQVARLSAFRYAMYRQDALYAALLALADAFEREAAAAAAAPPAAVDADCELGAAVLADDLTLLRAALERCAVTASGGALEAARAARDRLAKREKKSKAREKKAVVAAAKRPEGGAGSSDRAGATRAEPAIPSGAPVGAVHDFMTRRRPAADDADDSEDEETAAALAAAAEARARRRAEGEG